MLIKAGTIIHTPFEHCSIVATVRKLFCIDKMPFNWREAQAATFDDVLNLASDQVRQEKIVLPNPVVSPPLAGAAAAIMPPAMRVGPIYTAQDATNFLKQAAALIKAKG